MNWFKLNFAQLCPVITSLGLILDRLFRRGWSCWGRGCCLKAIIIMGFDWWWLRVMLGLSLQWVGVMKREVCYFQLGYLNWQLVGYYFIELFDYYYYFLHYSVAAATNPSTRPSINHKDSISLHQKPLLSFTLKLDKFITEHF